MVVVAIIAAATGSFFAILALFKCCTHFKGKSSSSKDNVTVSRQESPKICKVAYVEEVKVKSTDSNSEKSSHDGSKDDKQEDDDQSDHSNEKDNKSSTSSGSSSWWNNVSDFDDNYFEDDMHSGAEDTVEDDSFIFVANNDLDDFHNLLPSITEDDE